MDPRICTDPLRKTASPTIRTIGSAIAKNPTAVRIARYDFAVQHAGVVRVSREAIGTFEGFERRVHLSVGRHSFPSHNGKPNTYRVRDRFELTCRMLAKLGDTVPLPGGHGNVRLGSQRIEVRMESDS